MIFLQNGIANRAGAEPVLRVPTGPQNPGNPGAGSRTSFLLLRLPTLLLRPVHKFMHQGFGILYLFLPSPDSLKPQGTAKHRRCSATFALFSRLATQ